MKIPTLSNSNPDRLTPALPAERRSLLAAGLALACSGAFAGVAGSGVQDERRPPPPNSHGAPPVLPPNAQPFHYSLEEIARIVAPFNVGPRTTGTEPNTPFQLLYVNSAGSTTFTVKAGQTLYVPLISLDNTAPVLGRFPSDARERRAVLNYWFSPAEIGVTTMEIVIDGKRVSLGALYVQGLSFRHALPNGATQYITAGAFLSPLARGAHTVEVRFKATGAALREPPFDTAFPDGYLEFSIPYTVTVQ
ncbi:MAG: hypothetical protein RL260_1552 [Pseudomonadota bacterium]|jgi:hypothetical protein